MLKRLYVNIMYQFREGNSLVPENPCYLVRTTRSLIVVTLKSEYSINGILPCLPQYKSLSSVDPLQYFEYMEKVSLCFPLGYCKPVMHPQVCIVVPLLLQVCVVFMLLLQVREQYFLGYICCYHYLYCLEDCCVCYFCSACCLWRCGKSYHKHNNLFVVVFDNVGYLNTRIVVIHVAACTTTPH